MAIRETDNSDHDFAFKSHLDIRSFNFKESEVSLLKYRHLRKSSGKSIPKIYTARMSRSQNLVGISDDLGKSFVRLFLIKDNVEQFLEELRRYNGYRKSEYKMGSAVTGGFSYSPFLDLQQNSFYTAENTLFDTNSIKGVTESKHGFIPEDINAKTGQGPEDPFYVMSAAEAKRFCHEVLHNEGFDPIQVKLEHEPKANFAARFVIENRNSFWLNGDNNCYIGISTRIPIYRFVLLHEIAHYLDMMEFKSLSHGPTFVLVAAELYSKYIRNMAFEHVYNHFEVVSNLKVANAIYSERFETLSPEMKKKMRERFEAEGNIE